jgi:hypothetical protein
MKKRLVLLLSVLVSALSVFSQIPNNGFENWTNAGGYSTPDEWGNLNTVTSPAGVFTCAKGTPGNPGAAYIRLTSRTVPGMGIQPGIAVSGVLNTTSFEAISGFGYTDRPASLDGYWQYMAGGSDQGFIAVYLTKWNAGLNERDTVGRVKYPLPGMVMSWRSFSLPLTYTSSDVPDTAIIILSASGKTPVSGSYLYIDNLIFAGGTVGVEKQVKENGISLFPNPVFGNELKADLRNVGGNAECIDIVDLNGSVMLRETMIFWQVPVSIDISGLRPGEYILRVTTAEGSFCRKFIRK